jgi:Subtilase family
MDPVFDAQYRNIKDAFLRRGSDIRAAYKPNGDVDYVYEVDRLLTVQEDDNVERLSAWLPGIRRADEQPEPIAGDLVVLTIDRLERGPTLVPEALEIIDRHLGDDHPAKRTKGGRPPASPNHVLHITRLCPATEPEVPGGNPGQPFPPQQPAGAPVRAVLVGVSDTGLLAGLDPAQYPWLTDVSGEFDQLGRTLPSGQTEIPEFKGHGTFIAGVTKCVAPHAAVFVNDHFTLSGAESESVIVAKLEELAARSPDIINLSAGTYTRNNWTSLGFDTFNQRHPDITLVAAAGNDSTDREFYPAAYPWVVAVGALGADLQHRAWFSNYGPWVDVYALGEGHINAYATGEYIYQEPPKRPAHQVFAGMARWDGTSFAAPTVAGMIAARMARQDETSTVARAAVLAFAGGQALPGIGPVLCPGDQP